MNRNFREIFLLCLLAGLLYFPALGWRDFWAPVEPRYAEIARAMLAKGDWIVPTVNGELYTDKPILYFWLVLAGSWIAGAVNEWTVRLPSALSGLALVLTTYFLGRDILGPRVGFMGAAVLATCARVLWEARWAHTDMTFSFLFALSLYFFWRAALGKGRPVEFVPAYALMAMATLTKGLIGLVLPGFIAALFAAAQRDWRAILKWWVPTGTLVVLLIAGPWFVSVSLLTEGRWLSEFIFTHHLQRYTAGLGHRQPFYYYFISFPVDFLPWTVFLVPALWAYRSRLSALKEPGALFLAVWFLAVFVFFTLSDTKRDLYLLPLFPPAALFIACYFSRLVDREIVQGLLYRFLGLVFFSLLGLAALALPVLVWLYQRDAFGISLPLALALAGGAWTTMAGLWRRLPERVFLGTVATIVLAGLCAAIWLLPFLNAFKSPRPFALAVERIVSPGKPLFIYADTMNDFNFYTGREVIAVISSAAELDTLLARADEVYILVRERDIKRGGFERRGEILAQGRVGDKKWHLLLLRR